MTIFVTLSIHANFCTSWRLVQRKAVGNGLTGIDLSLPDFSRSGLIQLCTLALRQRLRRT